MPHRNREKRAAKKAQAEEQALAQARADAQLQEQIRTQAEEQALAQARAETQAQMQAQAQAHAQAQAQMQAQIQAQAQALAQAQAQAQARPHPQPQPQPQPQSQPYYEEKDSGHDNYKKRRGKKYDDYDDYDDDDYYDDDYYDDDDDYDDDPPKRRGRGAIVAIIVIVAILAGGYYGLTTFYSRSLAPVDPNDTREVTIVIPEGASTASIASILSTRGLIRNTYVFRYHSQRMEYSGEFKYGEYTLSKSMSVDEIAEQLMEGVVYAATKTFTIVEGLHIRQVAQALVQQGIVSESDFFDEVENGVFYYDFLADCPPGRDRLEGFLYPETYEVFEDVTAYEVIDKMLSEFNSRFKPEYYGRAEELGMTVREVVTLASIVERESVVASERPLMAGVFHNRIEQGMRLESCATVQYILPEPKEHLLIADTQIESPYNTYLIDGLPPGPICSPRMASIEAALYPDENEYIFFVLADTLDGTHMFSTDYNEFERNKAAYYRAVDALE
ncbi:MAG: endolytic transglycosylase MltG [Clostridiales bacterium]|nr:endolytic transglycosylase MltG [Clostridiales bacterium]